MPARTHDPADDILGAFLAPLADDPAGAVAFLARLADRVALRRRGRVLVLGDDYVAAALTDRGYPVTAGRLPEEPQSGVRFGSTFDGRFDVVHAGIGALSRQASQREQVRLVRRLAGLLRPGGALVLQSQAPDPAGWAADGRDIDCVRQLVPREGAVRPVRFVWPAELDLMAELAELSLDSRAGGWHEDLPRCGGPVVSVYRS
jgi:hypothetical protein